MVGSYISRCMQKCENSDNNVAFDWRIKKRIHTMWQSIMDLLGQHGKLQEVKDIHLRI